jgi:flagellar biogenesis protein FliO
MRTFRRSFRLWRLFRGTLAIVLACLSWQVAAADTPVEPIPYKRDSTSSESDLTRVMIGLGLCGLALAGAVYILRRRLNRNEDAVAKVSRLRVLETLRLNQRSTLYVVEFAGSCYMVAESGQGISCLASAPTRNSTNPGQA